jgi:hypothetical protein
MMSGLLPEFDLGDEGKVLLKEINSWVEEFQGIEYPSNPNLQVQPLGNRYW